MFGPNGIIDTNKPPKQWTKSREGSARKVTFADDTEESIIKSVASTTGLPKIDEDSDNDRSMINSDVSDISNFQDEHMKDFSEHMIRDQSNQNFRSKSLIERIPQKSKLERR